MAKMGKFSFDGLKELQKKLNKIQQKEMEAFCEDCAKELAARLLAKAIKRTPVGDYYRYKEVTVKRDSKKHKKGDVYKKRIKGSNNGKLGGTLRRGWTAKTQKEAEKGSSSKLPSVDEALSYVSSLKIEHTGNVYRIEIANPVEYFPYVEYGHRSRDHKKWIQGRFMLTISEQEVQKIAPQVLETKIEKFLMGVMQ